MKILNKQTINIYDKCFDETYEELVDDLQSVTITADGEYKVMFRHVLNKPLRIMLDGKHLNNLKDYSTTYTVSKETFSKCWELLDRI